MVSEVTSCCRMRLNPDPGYRNSMHDVEKYLLTCRELCRFCSQNGWIDNDTLRFEILQQDKHFVLVNVEFEELLMEGAGCLAGRVSCYGQIRLCLDESGRIVRSEIA